MCVRACVRVCVRAVRVVGLHIVVHDVIGLIDELVVLVCRKDTST